MTPIHLTLIALGGVLLLSATSAAQSSSSEPDSVEVARVDTYDFSLTISRLGGHGRSEFRVRTDSDVVFRDTMSYLVMVHTVTRWGDRPVALLQLSSGGTACPSTYRIMEFTGRGPPRVSAEFGNCSDLPVVLLDETHFRVRFPGFYHDQLAREPGFRRPPAATWEYLGDGRVRRVTAAPAKAPR